LIFEIYIEIQVGLALPTLQIRKFFHKSNRIPIFITDLSSSVLKIIVMARQEAEGEEDFSCVYISSHSFVFSHRLTYISRFQIFAKMNNKIKTIIKYVNYYYGYWHSYYQRS
jgi:hypothetical protein